MIKIIGSIVQVPASGKSGVSLKHLCLNTIRLILWITHYCQINSYTMINAVLDFRRVKDWIVEPHFAKHHTYIIGTSDFIRDSAPILILYFICSNPLNSIHMWPDYDQHYKQFTLSKKYIWSSANLKIIILSNKNGKS